MISALLSVSTFTSCVGIVSRTRMMTPPLCPSLSSFRVSYPLIRKACSEFRCVSWMHATSMFCSLRKLVRASFLFRTPSAFHCMNCIVVLWLLTVCLFASSVVLFVALRRAVVDSSVAEGGPIRGIGPGSLPDW